MRVPPAGHLVRLGFALALSAGPGQIYASQASTAPCTSPPPAPTNLTLKALASDGPSRLFDLTWSPGASNRPDSANDAVEFLIEVGSTPGGRDVAAIGTEGATRRYVTPVPNGTFHVRVRGRNACGDSAPSNERVQRVRDSVEQGVANAAVVLDTVRGIREAVGASSFVTVTGQVRNGWGAAPAAFVEVSATFDGPRGGVPYTVAGFVNGSAGRLARSGLLTDTVLEPNASGCFALFAEVPAQFGRVTGLTVRASASPVGVAPLEAAAAAVASPPVVDEFGDLVIRGVVRSEHAMAGEMPEVWADVRGADGKVVGCRSTLASAGAQGMVFEVKTEVEASAARGLTLWVVAPAFPSPDATAPPRARALWDRLRARQRDDAASQHDIAEARDALRRDILFIERGGAR